jgi:hypothetical protein
LSVRRFCSWQRGVDMLLRNYHCFATLLFATGDGDYQKRCNDTRWHTRS